jgi:TetR/AcrR family transcriptional regulator, mexJK operon transcriptional repressor
MDRTDIKTGRPSKEQAEALGDHVVEVADMLFIENGYGATSMATVASRAHVGKQTLYRRFPDKAALFREVIRRRIDAMVVTPADGGTDRDPLSELKEMGRAALDNVLDPQFIRLYRIIIAEALPFPELACAASNYWGSSFKDRCIHAIRRAQATGSCKPGTPETLAQCFLWSLVGEAFLDGLSGQERLDYVDDREARLELVWQVFLGGISVAQSEAHG